jgi:Na+/H+-translocating membrane pyrophosphatase
MPGKVLCGRLSDRKDELRAINRKLTQVGNRSTACRPGWSLAPACFAGLAGFAGEGVTAKGSEGRDAQMPQVGEES